MRLSVHKEIQQAIEQQAVHTILLAAAFMRENGQPDLADKWLDETLEPAIRIDAKTENA